MSCPRARRRQPRRWVRERAAGLPRHRGQRPEQAPAWMGPVGRAGVEADRGRRVLETRRS